MFAAVLMAAWAAVAVAGYPDYDGQPWVRQADPVVKISQGLLGRHISVWASHGRYYSHSKHEWRWQRINLFGTNEDLYTQTIVVPFLIPMLENAGAVVFTPRERDWQRNEVVVDNDDPRPGTTYIEVEAGQRWRDAGTRGFARPAGNLREGQNPFEFGSARMAKATGKKKRQSLVCYQPRLAEAGDYAVYVSYPKLDNAVDDAAYTVWHQGVPTEVKVNQRMGAGTWVYIGTYKFDSGSSERNRVVVSNLSGRSGAVGTDAVRFGGGMGTIEREGATSRLPRCLEGARYWAQYAGAPMSVYSTKGGYDDYKDDINTRSLFTNYLGGGSPFMPDTVGLKVPIELSLAVHSDAGYDPTGLNLVGTLGICTTASGDGTLPSGISRTVSKTFADNLLAGIDSDIKAAYGSWAKRFVRDANYSETRLPNVPSAIIETLSHQSFPDMRFGQDPNFRFTLARSIYKTILRQISASHKRSYAVQPLTPEAFCVRVNEDGEAVLSWEPKADPTEPTAKPSTYIIYAREGNDGYADGVNVGSGTSVKIKLTPGVLYGFRVAAANKGGVSFRSEELCALYNPAATKSVAIVDGFHRLSSPAVVDNAREQGFDISADPGVGYGKSPGWVGRQICFNKEGMGREDETGLGFSGDELTGIFIAGNDGTHVREHAEAIATAGRYTIASCSAQALEWGRIDLARYDAADIVLGLECNDGHSLRYYKTFSTTMRKVLSAYQARGGNIFVSGAYIGSDMQRQDERQWLATALHLQCAAYANSTTDGIYGMGAQMRYFNAINERHYAATSHDIFQPLAPAFAAMNFEPGKAAAIAYPGPGAKTFAMGIPFECLRDAKQRAGIMRGIMLFLTGQ